MVQNGVKKDRKDRSLVFDLSRKIGRDRSVKIKRKERSKSGKESRHEEIGRD